MYVWLIKSKVNQVILTKICFLYNTEAQNISSNNPYCGKHKDPLQYFCNDPSCSQLLCCQCLGTGEHSHHDWMELGQALMSMQARLEQAGHVTKEDASTAQRQMRALRTEEDRLQSKCETAKAIIHTNIGDIRSQLDNRKAYFEHNLEHTAQCHSFLDHRKPRETLSIEYEALQELWKHGEHVLAGLASRDAMSLGEVEKLTDRLKKIQDTVTKIKTQCSLPTSQFFSNSDKVRAKLSNYGEVKVDTFEQKALPLPQYSSTEPGPYGCFTKEQRTQSRSAIDLHASPQPSFSKAKQHYRSPSLVGHFVLPALPLTQTPTNDRSLLPSQILRTKSLRTHTLAKRRISTWSHDDTYDDTVSSFHVMPQVPSFSPPLPPGQYMPMLPGQHDDDDHIYEVPTV